MKLHFHPGRHISARPRLLIHEQYRHLSSSTFASDASAVRLLEVGPRDGLQNIKQSISTPLKVELIRKLAITGLKNIEATSFVSPKWVPQLSDGADVMRQILPLIQQQQIRFPVLTPNAKGLENALKSGAKEVVVFASATEAFSKKNQNCTVDEALNGAQKVAEEALKHGLLVRGVVSCIFSDPYSGPTPPQHVLYVVRRFLEMGCYEVGLGDTLGVGTPKDTQSLLEQLLKEVPAAKLAGHFHDTYGQAVSNVVRAYDMGLRTFDSSIAGLGGCPYAKGAKGNLATEDIVYTFEKSGIDTGIDLGKLVSVGDWISGQLGLSNGSRAGAALVAKSQSAAQTSQASRTSPKREWKAIQDHGDYRVSRAGSAVKITLTRPKHGNAMTRPMLDGIIHYFKSIANDPSIFHVIMSADGKYFCTGMDLSTNNERTDMDNDSSYYSKALEFFSVIDNAPQTTVAMIDGSCFGGGVGLGFAFDIRLASTRSRWTLTEIKLGLSPAIISKYLIREWGVSFLREAMLTGREVSAEELKQIGAVHGVAATTEELDVLLEQYLDKLSLCAPRAATANKELIRAAWTAPGGSYQNEVIKQTFDNMMKPDSEGQFGIAQFQKKVKGIDWSHFWSSRQAKI